ncbi:hypothetical protein ID866_10071 [Astraeus odoratus]|nr:hypothetical protein ID866_10071 [Astraeus odoratus]
MASTEPFLLSARLRAVYPTPPSPCPDVIDTRQVKFYVKAGGEGPAILSSIMAVLPGLYPPSTNNKITLANESTIIAPLSGYQYIPIETVQPANDRSLEPWTEPWTDCLAFRRHVTEVYASPIFKATAKAAQSFFRAIKDFVFGCPITLENAYNIYDYVSTLVHNQTHANRLPPTFIDQACKNALFSDTGLGGVGYLAGQMILCSILDALDPIPFNEGPLQSLLIETSYQPFISLFHMLGLTKEYPELAAMANFASALALEIRRGPGLELRDFLRIKSRTEVRTTSRRTTLLGTRRTSPLRSLCTNSR